jgi:hypothetical protein
MNISENQSEELAREAKKQEVVALLQKHNVPVDKWGQGGTKTLEHLLTEVDQGEALLVENEAGELTRELTVADVEVRYMADDGSEERLMEAEQVFTNGQTRSRNLPTSLSEKLKPGEDIEQSVIRAVQEELGIEDDLTAKYDKLEETTTDSPSFPGLKSTYKAYYYTVHLNKDQYRAEGYQERQPDKTTYFVWVKVETAP